jgi:hypothetical protein
MVVQDRTDTVHHPGHAVMRMMEEFPRSMQLDVVDKLIE